VYNDAWWGMNTGVFLNVCAFLRVMIQKASAIGSQEDTVVRFSIAHLLINKFTLLHIAAPFRVTEQTFSQLRTTYWLDTAGTCWIGGWGLGSFPPRNVREFAGALVEEWDNVSQQELANLVQSSRRCTAVLNAAGGHQIQTYFWPPLFRDTFHFCLSHVCGTCSVVESYVHTNIYKLSLLKIHVVDSEDVYFCWV
jgi:hypothetical protein